MTDDDEMIWRYMDLTKYVGLLSRGLFFAQASAFADPWEGAWSVREVTRFREGNVSLSRPAIAIAWQDRYDRKRESFKRIGMSCWHISSTENAALWDVYVPLGMGIALRSTPRRVAASLKAIGRSSQWRAVEYTDYKERPTGDDPVNLLSHKRQEFAFERELRFFIEFRQDEIDAVEWMAEAMKSRTRRHVAAGPVGPLAWASGGFGTFEKTVVRRAAPGGIHCETAAAGIVEAVYLAPSVSYPVRRAVLDVTEKFGVSRKLIQEATMSTVPPDRLEFHDPMLELHDPMKKHGEPTE